MRNLHRAVGGAGLSGAAVGLAAAALLIWSGAGVGQAARTAEVKIDNFTFAPDQVTIAIGTTVTWRNEDDIPHTVASASRLFKSKALDTDDSFSFTFAAPGVYEYFCSLHPQMKATIVVEAAADQK